MDSWHLQDLSTAPACPRRTSLSSSTFLRSMPAWHARQHHGAPRALQSRGRFQHASSSRSQERLADMSPVGSLQRPLALGSLVAIHRTGCHMDLHMARHKALHMARRKARRTLPRTNHHASWRNNRACLALPLASLATWVDETLVPFAKVTVQSGQTAIAETDGDVVAVLRAAVTSPEPAACSADQSAIRERFPKVWPRAFQMTCHQTTRHQKKCLKSVLVIIRYACWVPFQSCLMSWQAYFGTQILCRLRHRHPRRTLPRQLAYVPSFGTDFCSGQIL